MVINLENSWIIHDNKLALYPNSYQYLEDAKIVCNNIPDEEKKSILDGAAIYHVVNGDVISQVDVIVTERKYGTCNFFSPIHIIDRKFPYNLIALEKVRKSVPEYEQLYDKIQETTNSISNFVGAKSLERYKGCDEKTIDLLVEMERLSSELSDTAHELEEHLAWD